MFLSRLTLTTRSPDVLARLVDSYGEHQIIWDCFSGDPAASRDFLFRREHREGLPVYFVVSEREPVASNVFAVESKSYEPDLRAGDRLAFTLRVNPVVRRRDETGKQTRHDVVMDYKKRNDTAGMTGAMIAHRAGHEWLAARAERLGFHLSEGELNVEGYQQHKTSKRSQNNGIRFSTLDFRGILTTIEPAALVEALKSGIGPSKAFGCGLMLLRRV